MAKRRKKRKTKQKQEFAYSAQITGIIFIVLAVLGFGIGTPLGFVGRIIKCIAVFLFGSLNWIFFLALITIGLFMLFKGEGPSIFSTKFIGLFIVLLGVFSLVHLYYVIDQKPLIEADIMEISQNDIKSWMNIIRDGEKAPIAGGGYFGAGLLSLQNYLFAEEGTRIVSIILIAIGTCIFTGFSIIDFIKDGLSKRKEQSEIKKAEKEKIKEEKAREQEKEKLLDKEKEVIINDNTASKDDQPEQKIVVSSIDELKKINNESKEEKENKEDIEALLNDVEVEQPKPAVHNTSSNYVLPTLALLKKNDKKSIGNSKEVIENNINIIETTLREFGIIGKVVEVNSGPAVTQYELEIQAGTKLNKLLGINREISLALAKKDVRIQAPIPGKSTVGIEVPNESISMVSLREILENVPQNKVNNKLLVALGKNIMGKSMFCEINKTPHLLVAGSTGSGKSVCINCIISSILMRAKPDEVKLVLVDPKKVELSMYNGIPHLLMPVVTDPRKASVALQKIVSEMERRYDTFSDNNVKNIEGYNEMVEKENAVRAQEDKLPKMNYIVVIIDELADLMLVASKEVEDSIMRITQMARAAGIHLIVATQRPSTDVITGVVKANIPSRISFAVSSQIDSRTILDMAGAEKLLGKGDMLFLPMGEGSPERIQGAFVSDEEIEALIDYSVKQQIAQYDETFTNLEVAKDMGNAGGEPNKHEDEEYDDPLYDEIVEFVISSGKASASYLQRRFKLGYNRAARIIDLLEERGIVGPANGSKPREVLVKIEGNEETEDN